eukprot:TRINITY_DN56214_c0_g1_i1.p1 TRINITY_DN56214_c0_g1~~TRINITY_DN56214_c0_g1_i1.p1  ORF type:complete len:529 (+),score=32.28 TRINITY_DN56214_c0_g1_i1:41-1627(+)
MGSACSTSSQRTNPAAPPNWSPETPVANTKAPFTSVPSNTVTFTEFAMSNAESPAPDSPVVPLTAPTMVVRQRVCSVADFPDGGSRLIRGPDGRNIAVFHHRGRFYAMDNACYHHGGPLWTGSIREVEGHQCVKCPWHGYLLDLEDGNGLYMGLGKDMQTQQVKSKGPKQRVHAVEVVGNFIEVLIDLTGKWESDQYATMPMANRPVPGGSGVNIHSTRSDTEPQRSGMVLRHSDGLGVAYTGRRVTPVAPIGGWTATCVQVIQETPKVKTFLLALTKPRRNAVEPGPTYLPGQHAVFDTPLHGEAAPPARRTWTISSAPNSPYPPEPTHITISVKLKEGGLGSTWLHENMEPGAQLQLVEIGGNFGVFFPNPVLQACGGNMLLICAGIGITPMASMLRGLFSPPCSLRSPVPSCPNRGPFDIAMLYSERTFEEFAFRSELERYAADDSASGGHQFRLFLTLTGPPQSDWSGLTGRITGKMVEQLVPDFRGRCIFMCGPETFMDSLTQQLVSLGLSERSIFTESFGAL